MYYLTMSYKIFFSSFFWYQSKDREKIAAIHQQSFHVAHINIRFLLMANS